MLSYQHAFHAGNHADLLKHLVLTRVLTYLTVKPAPLLYVDTHSGSGGYRLDSKEALKLQEYRQGIGVLWGRDDIPEQLEPLLSLVTKFNRGATELNFYPGSPWLARQLLRPVDRLELCELHPTDYARLRKQFGGDSKVRCHYEDGYKHSLSLLPPIEKRGLVLIDPSYEEKKEYQQVVDHLLALHKRFATGIYALWYPVVEQDRIERLQRQLVRSGIRRIDVYELYRDREQRQVGMNGSGMIVINPPWQLREEITTALEYLAPLVGEAGRGGWRVQELVGE
ncbi:MAG: ribosomal RNA large subunit methyltransferase J [Gammaproteobacteria bacterium BRH_c0]|nr:MAG: ribosomal RNA large subunit methyltransferase J [Gammaproteobacteria bacterium BRH_c0]